VVFALVTPLQGGYQCKDHCSQEICSLKFSKRDVLICLWLLLGP